MCCARLILQGLSDSCLLQDEIESMRGAVNEANALHASLSARVEASAEREEEARDRLRQAACELEKLRFEARGLMTRIEELEGDLKGKSGEVHEAIIVETEISHAVRDLCQQVNARSHTFVLSPSCTRADAVL